jgi:hypothetical protein
MSRTKQGNFLPFFTVDIPDEAEFASALSQALRTELRQHRSWAKVVARWTGANERTAKNWLAGRMVPNGYHLMLLMRHSEVVTKVVLAAAGCKNFPSVSTK